MNFEITIMEHIIKVFDNDTTRPYNNINFQTLGGTTYEKVETI